MTNSEFLDNLEARCREPGTRMITLTAADLNLLHRLANNNSAFGAIKAHRRRVNHVIEKIKRARVNIVADVFTALKK